MIEEEIDAILLDIVKEFIQPENSKFLDEQKLASSIFYSFAIGTLTSNEIEEEKINNLEYVINWLHEKEDILKNYGEQK